MELHTLSTLHKTRGKLIVKGLIKDRPVAFTVDTGTTVSVLHPDIVRHLQPQLNSFPIWTMTGSHSPVSYTHLDVYKRQFYNSVTNLLIHIVLNV